MIKKILFSLAICALLLTGMVVMVSAATTVEITSVAYDAATEVYTVEVTGTGATAATILVVPKNELVNVTDATAATLIKYIDQSAVTANKATYTFKLKGAADGEYTVFASANDATAPAQKDFKVATFDAKKAVFLKDADAYVLPNEVKAANGAEKVLYWEQGGAVVTGSVASTDGLAPKAVLFDKKNTDAGREASLRLAEENQGIRFSTKFDKATVDALAAAGVIEEFGTMVAKLSTFDPDTEITGADFAAALTASKKVIKIKTTNVARLDGDVYQYGGVITGLSEEAHYTADLVAIGYIQYKVGGTSYYLFADDTAAVANAREIANSLTAEETEGLLPAVEAWLNQVKG